MCTSYDIRLGTVLICLVLIAGGCSDVNGPGTGRIQVALTTSGDELDPDGYRIGLENGALATVDLNATVPFGNLPAGSTLVRLFGLEPNCRTVEPNPTIVTVVSGKTVNVTFTVICELYTGSILVRTQSTGGLPDPDGYSISLNPGYTGSKTQVIGSNDSVTFRKVAKGSQVVILRQAARNCTFAQPDRSVVVTPGKTTEVIFSVRCEQGGNLRVITRTSGIDFDPSGYNALISAQHLDTLAVVPVDGTMLLAGVAATDFTVTLAGLASNCQVTSPRSISITVPIGGSVDAAFDVICTRASARLAVVSTMNGNSEIYVIDFGDATPARVTFHPALDHQPAWSPDGSRIAFVSTRHGNSEIYVMNVDGSNVRRLTEHSSADEHPTWSPDGSRIAFDSNRGGDFDIYTMNADGSNLDRITQNSTYDGQPNWSVRNQIVYIGSIENGQREVRTMNAFGADVITLTHSNHEAASPKWSPDGTRIVFARAVYCSSGFCQSDIFVVNADGSAEQRLNTGFANSSHYTEPSWSSDGQRIAFTAQQCADYYYYGIYCSSAAVYVLNLAGGAAGSVLSFEAWNATWR